MHENEAVAEGLDSRGVADVVRNSLHVIVLASLHSYLYGANHPCLFVGAAK